MFLPELVFLENSPGFSPSNPFELLILSLSPISLSKGVLGTGTSCGIGETVASEFLPAGSSSGCLLRRGCVPGWSAVASGAATSGVGPSSNDRSRDWKVPFRSRSCWASSLALCSSAGLSMGTSCNLRSWYSLRLTGLRFSLAQRSNLLR